MSVDVPNAAQQRAARFGASDRAGRFHAGRFRSPPLLVIAVFGLVAIFLERVLVVFPSVMPQGGFGIGLREILVTAGFLALFLLSRRWFFDRYRATLNLPPTSA